MTATQKFVLLQLMTAKILRTTRKMLGVSLYRMSVLSGFQLVSISKMERGEQKIKEKHEKVFYPLLRSECRKRIAELEKREGELK